MKHLFSDHEDRSREGCRTQRIGYPVIVKSALVLILLLCGSATHAAGPFLSRIASIGLPGPAGQRFDSRMLVYEPPTATETDAPAVVFVCEHGAAKSLIATAYFNKLAAERGLPFRATFRGATPQDDLSVQAVAGLRADGLAVPAGKPSAITDADVAAATHIFAIGCMLPAKARASGKTADWSDVPDDRGYIPMRDAILRHVTALLDDLQKKPAVLRRFDSD